MATAFKTIFEVAEEKAEKKAKKKVLPLMKLKLIKKLKRR
jgi:hypothetical protein